MIEGLLTPTERFNLKVDTENRLSNLNQKDTPYVTSVGVDPISIPKTEDTYSILRGEDSNKKDILWQQIFNDTEQGNRVKLNAGFEINTPTEYSDKFIGKDFGFDPTRDNEDTYHQDYMKDNWFVRTVKNVPRFVSRVAVGAGTKFFEGLGYLGRGVFEIGDELLSHAFKYDNNAWADIADNAFSKVMQNAEQSFKNRVAPVYKAAGFDEKGFFSKLGDATFWNDAFADGVSFLVSAIAPAGIASKLGLLARGASKFQALNKILGGSLKTITGSETLGEMGLVAFNTANESAFEAAETFRQNKEKLLRERAEGKNTLTDRQIDNEAGTKAASTFGWNMAALTFSNAWEMKNIIKPLLGRNSSGAIRNVLINSTGEAIAKATPKLLANRVAKDLMFYGKKGLQATLAEGYWEENIQTAIQRSNLGSYTQKLDDGTTKEVQTEGGIKNILSQWIEQTKDASTLFGGEGDKEVAEAIGLGGLIGIFGGGLSSKFGKRQNPTTKQYSYTLGERRQKELQQLHAITEINNAKNNAFSFKDVYDEDGSVNRDKFLAKVESLNEFAEKQTLLESLRENKDIKIHDVKFLENSLLNQYIKNIIKTGNLDTVVDRFNSMVTRKNQQEAFMRDPIEVASYIQRVGNLYTDIQEKDIQGKIPKGVTYTENDNFNQARKDIAFDLLSEREAMTPLIENYAKVINADLDFYNNDLSPEDLKNNGIEYTQQLAKKKFFEELAQKDTIEFVKPYYQARIKEAEERLKQLDDLLGEFKPSVKDGKIVDAEPMHQRLLDNYLTSYSNQAFLEFYQDQNDFIANKLLDKEKGLDNYNALMDFYKTQKAKKEAERAKQQTTPIQTQTQVQTIPSSVVEELIVELDKQNLTEIEDIPNVILEQIFEHPLIQATDTTYQQLKDVLQIQIFRNANKSLNNQTEFALENGAPITKEELFKKLQEFIDKGDITSDSLELLMIDYSEDIQQSKEVQELAFVGLLKDPEYLVQRPEFTNLFTFVTTSELDKTILEDIKKVFETPVKKEKENIETLREELSKYNNEYLQELTERFKKEIDDLNKLENTNYADYGEILAGKSEYSDFDRSENAIKLAEKQKLEFEQLSLKRNEIRSKIYELIKPILSEEEKLNRASVQEALKEIWSKINSSVDLLGGAAIDFSSTLEEGIIPAHGMAKESFAGSLNELFTLFNNGIDPTGQKGGLETAPLTKNVGDAGAYGSTGDGTAYKDGSFILLSNTENGIIKDLSEITGILVNDSIVNLDGSVIGLLQKAFPNIQIGSFSEARSVIQKINNKPIEEKVGNYIIKEQVDGKWKIFNTKGESLALIYDTKEEAIEEIRKSEERERLEKEEQLRQSKSFNFDELSHNAPFLKTLADKLKQGIKLTDQEDFYVNEVVSRQTDPSLVHDGVDAFGMDTQDFKNYIDQAVNKQFIDINSPITVVQMQPLDENSNEKDRTKSLNLSDMTADNRVVLSSIGRGQELIFKEINNGNVVIQTQDGRGQFLIPLKEFYPDQLGKSRQNNSGIVGKRASEDTEAIKKGLTGIDQTTLREKLIHFIEHNKVTFVVQEITNGVIHRGNYKPNTVAKPVKTKSHYLSESERSYVTDFVIGIKGNLLAKTTMMDGDTKLVDFNYSTLDSITDESLKEEIAGLLTKATIQNKIVGEFGGITQKEKEFLSKFINTSKYVFRQNVDNNYYLYSKKDLIKHQGKDEYALFVYAGSYVNSSLKDEILKEEISVTKGDIGGELTWSNGTKFIKFNEFLKDNIKTTLIETDKDGQKGYNVVSKRLIVSMHTEKGPLSVKAINDYSIVDTQHKEETKVVTEEVKKKDKDLDPKIKRMIDSINKFQGEQFDDLKKEMNDAIKKLEDAKTEQERAKEERNLANKIIQLGAKAAKLNKNNC